MYFVFNVETRPESHADFNFEKGVFKPNLVTDSSGDFTPRLLKKKKFILFRHLRNCR